MYKTRLRSKANFSMDSTYSQILIQYLPHDTASGSFYLFLFLLHF